MFRGLAFLVLVLFVNAALFSPMVDEKDIFDKAGCQVDDINSAYEFIDQVVLGNYDETPEDEDDDKSHFFQLVKAVFKNDKLLEFNIITNYFILVSEIKYRFEHDMALPLGFQQVISPPPDLG